MAAGTGAKFHEMQILIGNGATPTEVFSLLCGVTSKEISYETETVTTEMPDCSDESLPSFKQVGIKSYGVTLKCSGMWTKEAHPVLMAWFQSSAAKNIKCRYVNAAVGSPEYVNGPAVLTNMSNSVEKGGNLSGSFDIAFAATPTYVNKT